MNITIHQSIHIHLLRIGSVTNSSVIQIGSSGAIQAQSDIYNTGGFTEPAVPVDTEEQQLPTLVPLAPV